MIENEYIVDRNRYLKWTTPKFYALPIFYIYVCIFVSSIFLLFHLINHNGSKQMILLFFFVSLSVFYLAIFHKWVVAISQHKYMKKRIFGGKLWKCKVVIEDQVINLYVNDELTNTIKWNEITKLAEAKTFISLKKNIESEKIVLFDDSYIKGNREEMISFVKNRHSYIPIERERLRYDK